MEPLRPAMPAPGPGYRMEPVAEAGWAPETTLLTISCFCGLPATAVRRPERIVNGRGDRNPWDHRCDAHLGGRWVEDGTVWAWRPVAEVATP